MLSEEESYYPSLMNNVVEYGVSSPAITSHQMPNIFI